tara:strand:+ start:354 stop:479 length:126 start_codon:yes stop_codon:yes gene_type:complete
MYDACEICGGFSVATAVLPDGTKFGLCDECAVTEHEDTSMV